MAFGSSFVRHEPCPLCVKAGKDSSGDNLGRYSDGSAYCFSCCYSEKPNSLNLDQLVTKLGQSHGEVKPSKDKKNGSVALPDDFTSSLPQEAITWLKGYSITDAEIEQNRIGWSQQRERIIFPVYDKYHNLLMWQGRSLRKDRPKCHTEGLAEKTYHVLGDPDDPRICVVEDIISAIKVSRVLPAMPLWGSVLSTKRIITLSEWFQKLLIWLDYDKTDYAVKRGVYARQFFDDNVQVIPSVLDPKFYNAEQIRIYVTPNTNPL